MRFRLGYQLSITALFVAVVLAVGLALVFLSFDRARSITRSAALTFIDRVAEHTADRVDGQFKACSERPGGAEATPVRGVRDDLGQPVPLRNSGSAPSPTRAALQPLRRLRRRRLHRARRH